MMKHLLLITVCISLLFSCTENDTKKDVETNTYYSKYKYIFENYDSLGTEKSIVLIDEYINEFPNAIDAYKFKAFLFAKNNNFSDAEKTMLNNSFYPENKTDFSNYLVSLLLLDSLNISKAEKINIDLENNNLSNNKTAYNNIWVQLYRSNFSMVDSLVSLLINNDTTNNKKFIRLSYISAASQQDSIKFKNLLKEDTQEIHIPMLDSLIYGRISLQEYYQKLSK